MRRIRAALLAGLAALALVAAGGCAAGGTDEDGDDPADGDDDDGQDGDEGGGGGNPGCGPARGTVVQVIDGDTIQLDSGDRIRYLLVDTPENTSEVECYGPESTRFNSELVEGADVELTYDQECADDYDRLLAYVTVQGREINSLLVERGFACALYIPPNGEDRRDEFETLESRARAESRGLWGACPENPCN
jgi:micrococcal nuclease